MREIKKQLSKSYDGNRPHSFELSSSKIRLKKKSSKIQKRGDISPLTPYKMAVLLTDKDSSLSSQ